MRKQSIWRSTAARRAGFTLLELLIVVAIMLLLAVMTAYAINLSTNTDKVRAAARQVQSYLAGARDRAIYAQAPRGVRFLLDPTNNRTVSSLVFIQQTDPWTQGTVQLERLDTLNVALGVNNLTGPPNIDGYPGNPNPPALVLRGFDNDPNASFQIPTGWVDLMHQGLLYNGSQVLIPNSPTGILYTVTIDLLPNASPAGTPAASYYPPRLHLTTACVNASTNPIGNAINAFVSGPTTYSLILPPSLMPGSDPVQLPKGSVIHLDRCTTSVNLEQTAAATFPNRGDKLPSSWKQTPSAPQTFTGGNPDPTNFDYTTTMDILFSPHGVVTGPAGQRGIIHLYIGEQMDADRDRLTYWASTTYPTQSTPEYGQGTDGNLRGDKVVCSLFTRTGAVWTSSIFSNVDPFKFAETGQVAGK